MIRVNESFVIDDALVSETFVRASGPGGQNVNKVSTAVELRVDVANSGLPPDAMERIALLAGRQLTNDGVLVIQAQSFRSQERNRDDARQRVVQLFSKSLVRPKRRKPTKPTFGSTQRRLNTKQKHGQAKGLRNKKIEVE